MKDWNIAFHTENTEKIICMDEAIGDCHDLYLVNGESKMKASAACQRLRPFPESPHFKEIVGKNNGKAK